MAAPRLDQLKTGAMTGSSAPHARPQPGRYEIDTTCSAVTFSTRHLFGLAPVRGSFAIRTGTIHVAQPPSDSSIHVEIETASFRTSNRQRDRTVLSAALLDADRYPVVTFTASQVDGPALAGMLTAHGAAGHRGRAVPDGR